MRQIRLEEKIDEAVLPETIQSLQDSFKISPRMEQSTRRSEDQHDSTCPGINPNYREDAGH